VTSPTTSLPFPLVELMTNVTVLWEQSGAVDVFGQPSYAAPVEINCWMEPEGLGTDVGATVSRANFDQTILQQTRRPEVTMYFDGDDARAQSFVLTDRFTPPTTGLLEIKLMPTTIVTLYGPNFDNFNPWLVSVSF
jgi:hypothetical protein